MKKIFISYAKEDSQIAERLEEDLRRQGLEPWLDIKNIRPGANWREEVLKAIRNCRYFLALLSSSAVNKRGYVQREIREALEVLETFPPGDVFVIPVRLNECQPRHPKLEALQWVDLFPSYQEGLRKLLTVLRSRKAFNEATILWIDDNHANNQVIRDAWEAQGLKIMLADSTNDALKLLEDSQFDVIVTDLFRSEEGRYHAAGYELLNLLSERHMNVPVIIYTASIDAVDPQKARNAFGIADMPVHLYELIMAALADDR